MWKDGREHGGREDGILSTGGQTLLSDQGTS